MAGGPARLAFFATGGSGMSSSAMVSARQGHQGVSTAEEDHILCQLCLRQMEHYTVHHLVPRSRGGRFGPTVRLCPTCHRQLHALFAEATLAKELFSIELLRSNPQVANYLRWVRKRKGDVGFRVHRSNGRR